VNLLSKVIALGALMSLAGCDQVGALGSSGTEPAGAVEAAPVAPDVVAETKAKGMLVYGGGSVGVTVPAALEYSIGQQGWLFVSGTLEQPNSNGKTNGVSFELPAGLEEQLSGKLINIHVVATSDTEGEAFLAYSTNEVGNSGWMSLPVKTTDSVASFQYSVRELREGRGDFIGIDPNGHSLTIKAIVVEIAG
jgi:hypothetical protein